MVHLNIHYQSNFLFDKIAQSRSQGRNWIFISTKWFKTIISKNVFNVVCPKNLGKKSAEMLELRNYVIPQVRGV